MSASKIFPAAARLLIAALVAGCSVDDVDSLKNSAANASAEDTSHGPSAPKPAFAYGTELSLLPFDVRLEKVAHVAGVTTDDPLLEPLRQRRLELGDHDYGQGQKPDYTWTSARMGTWIRAILPICDSKEMRERFPSLPESLDALILEAYGRHASDEDWASFTTLPSQSSLDQDGHYRVVCLGVLTSLEFVAR